MAPSDSSEEIIFALTYKRNLGDLQSLKLSLHNVLLTILLHCSLFQPQVLTAFTFTFNFSMKPGVGVIIHQESNLIQKKNHIVCS